MKRWTLVLIGLALCSAAAIAYMWGLYEVMRIGTCASGGPYVSARPCPEGTGLRILAIMGGVFGGLIGMGIYSAGRPKHGSAAAGIGALMWFFLFAGGAGAMLLSGFGPARSDDSAQLVAVLLSLFFIPMGVIPLLGAVGFSAGRKKLKETGLANLNLPSGSSPATATAPSPAPPPAAAPGSSGDDPLDRLAQLEQLRKSGVVDAAEFERLKAEILRDS